ncbi:hypothetical protein [Candidatus Lokiarchaeum ossiferum]|uniref:hypothetical protein n=1 Tax=Candidatus Lokiarchaeum ossiferum TaxID=2951803 RepID=UPI00352D0B84
MISQTNLSNTTSRSFERPQEIKKSGKFMQLCPQCGEMLKFGIEQQDLEKQTHFPFPHVIIHGNPVHCLVVYIDAGFKVRGSESASSIEIKRDQDTFGQLIKKWSNPF